MKISKSYLITLLALAALIQGCKKEETTKESLTGSLKALNLPTYVEPGYTKSFCIDTMMTLTRGDGGDVGYYYKDPVTGVYDTLRRDDGTVSRRIFTITAPETTGTYSMTFGGYAGNYTGSSKSGSFTVVKPGIDGKGSLTNYVIKEGDSQFTDERDGKSYYYTVIDGTSWMRQNLAWEGAGRPFFDCSAMSSVFGHFYTWEEAQTACPAGWTLPTDADIVALGNKFGTDAQPMSDIKGLAGALMEDVYFNDTKMWEYWSTVKVTNKAGLSLIPVGYAVISGNEFAFDSIYKYAAFWTADASGDYGIFRYVYQGRDEVYFGKTSKTDFAASVRCLKK